VTEKIVDTRIMTKTPKIKVIKQLSGNYVLRIARFRDFGPSDELKVCKTLRDVQADLSSRFGQRHDCPSKWPEGKKEVTVSIAYRLTPVSQDYDHSAPITITPASWPW
jgi:hypothetical protein